MCVCVRVLCDLCVLENCRALPSSACSLRVRLSGTKALCNALEFTSANFEKEVCVSLVQRSTGTLAMLLSSLVPHNTFFSSPPPACASSLSE